jgi:hypothetical protein
MIHTASTAPAAATTVPTGVENARLVDVEFPGNDFKGEIVPALAELTHSSAG